MTAKTKTPDTDLFLEALDKAATALLARAEGSVTLDASGDGEGAGESRPADPVPLKEQVEAFRAAVAWFEIRAKHTPKEAEKGRGKFNGIQDRFNGASPGRGSAGPSTDA